MSQICFVSTKVGNLKISMKMGNIVAAEFIDDNINNNDMVDVKLLLDLTKYFDGSSTKLKSKIKMVGTEFQLKVWSEIMKIPYGETRTYGDIANAIDQPTAFRAVANACGQNRMALFIPCHRVVARKDIGGYKWGIDKKKWLLGLEKKVSKLAKN